LGFRITSIRAIALGTIVAVAGVTVPTALVVATAPSSSSPAAVSFTDVVLPPGTPDPISTGPSSPSRLPAAELADDQPPLASKADESVATWTAAVPPLVAQRPAHVRAKAATAVVKPKPKPKAKPARAAAAGYSSASVSGARARVVQVALAQRGDRYVSGGTGPNTFDCSGLVRYAYRIAGVSGKLGGGHSASAMYAWGKANGLTSRSNPRIGDVVIYGGGSHAGIYIGNGRIVSALNPSQGIRITGLHALGAAFTTFIHTRI
jgi:cell wall-associated NlpC family hydrolase